MAPPLAGHFVDVPFDVAPFVIPAVDVNGIHEPPLTWGFFLDGGDLAFSANRIEGAGMPPRYHFDGERLVYVGPLSPVYGVADLDGDGVLDRIEEHQVQWETGEVSALPGGQMVKDGALAFDLDLDGRLDVVTRTECGGTATTPVAIWLQAAPRRFVDATSLVTGAGPANTQWLWAGTIDGERVLMVLGWGCGANQAPVPTCFRWSGDRWSPFDLVPPGTPLPQPMGGAQIGDDFLVTLHPDHAIIRHGQRVELGDDFQVQKSDTGKPMIPWQIATPDLDGDGRLDAIITHGADEYFSGEVRGIGPQYVTAWRNESDGWARWESTGLERRGQWHAIASGTLGGNLALIVGALGEQPRVYRFVPN